MWEPDIATIAVADGMGGHNAGEVASQLALDSIKGFLQKSSVTDDFTWPFGFSPALSFAANRLMTAIKIANRRVFRASEERPDYTGMGTTVVAAIVEGSRVAFSGVGDSRIYSFLGNELTQITRDDSWVVMLMKESGLDASAFDKHPMRHVLTSVVGARPELEVTVEEMQLVDGQTLLFCSDGLLGGMSDHDIAGVLRGEPELEKAAERLVTLGVQRDGKDNVTVALARYSSRQ
jgi:protein phosphatase